MFSSYETILLADSDADDVFFFERVLQLAEVGSRLERVSTGPEILAYLEGNGKYANRERFPFPNWVFLETYLPQLNGLEVLERVGDFAGLPFCSVYRANGLRRLCPRERVGRGWLCLEALSNRATRRDA